MVVITTRAGIHGRNHHKARRVLHGIFGAGNCYFSVFQWLTHHFENISIKLRKFIQKQHSVVGQTDFTRLRIGSATDHGYITDGMVWGPEWPARHKGDAFFQFAGNAVYLCGFECLFKGERGEDRGHSFRHHRFPCAGRPYHNYIVATCSRYFQRPFHIFLSFYIAEVELEIPLVSKTDDLTDIIYPVNLQSFHNSCFFSIFRRKDEPFESVFLSHDSYR